MRVELYAGPLCRYYARAWQPAAVRQGTEAPVPAPPGAVTDPAEVLSVVLQWQAEVSARVEASVGASLDWDETPGAAWSSEQVGWRGLGGLLLAAALEPGDPGTPTQVPLEWGEHPAYAGPGPEAARGPRGQLLAPGIELWLPWPVDFVARLPDPTGQEIVVGSAPALADQLRALGAARPELTGGGPGPDLVDEPFLAAARRGFAAFTAMVDHALDAEVPLRLEVLAGGVG